MRVLVTGGAGYIGSFAVRALQERGHDVVVYDNLCFGHREAVAGPLVLGDLDDAATLDSCFVEGHFDAVMHFAAFIEAGESMRDASRFFQNNTGTSINLLNSMVRHGVKKLIFSSTAAVYAEGLPVPIEETARLEPANVYGETKLLVERMLPWYDRVHGIKSISLRYFNATGAALDGSQGQDHEPATHLITSAIKGALGQGRFVLFGDDYPTPDGTCIRDYIHVIDLASAHTLALDHLEQGAATDMFNAGTGTGHSVREVVSAVKRTSGVDFPIEVGARRAGDAPELVANSDKLKRRTGWSPQFSDLDTIVRSAWDWHRSHPNGYASPADASVARPAMAE